MLYSWGYYLNYTLFYGTVGTTVVIPILINYNGIYKSL